MLLHNFCLIEWTMLQFKLQVNSNKFKRKGESSGESGQWVKDPGCHLELIRSTVLVFGSKFLAWANG